MDLSSCFIILLCSYSSFKNVVRSERRSLIQETYKSVPRLIQTAGYPTEMHRAITSDGYILQLHRIPTGRLKIQNSAPSNTNDKKAVLLVHGVLGCSSNFILMGPRKSLGYMLADADYDVWLGNLRGNVHSAHLNLTKDNSKFWDYSFHEHGKYDVPALIDKVLTVSGQRKLLYIGHSMGTTSFFIAMTLKPAYNDKVLAFIALAPAVYFDHMKSLAEIFLKTIKIGRWMRYHDLISISLRPELVDYLVTSLCSARRLKDNICVLIMQAVVGEDFEQVDPDMITKIIARIQPASWGQMEHFAKIAITGVFTSWEAGVLDAVKPYNLSNLRVPVTLLYGDNDQITQKSVLRLACELNGMGMLDEIRSISSWPKFNHLDFLFAKNIDKLLNRPLIKLIQKLYQKYANKSKIYQL